MRTVEVPATKVSDHALGFTVIQYDTSLVQGSIASVTFSARVPKAQDKILLYGPRINGFGPGAKITTVTSIGPPTGDYKCEHFYYPINVDLLHFEDKEVLLPAFEMLQKGFLPPECRMLDAELETVQKIDVPVFGVPEGTALPRCCRAFTNASLRNSEGFPAGKGVYPSQEGSLKPPERLGRGGYHCKAGEYSLNPYV